MIEFMLDEELATAEENELLIEVMRRTGKEIPHLCYHAQLGPIQTCDTCLVEVDGKLVRSCGTKVTSQMKVVTESKKAKGARSEAFDVILGNRSSPNASCRS